MLTVTNAGTGVATNLVAQLSSSYRIRLNRCPSTLSKTVLSNASNAFKWPNSIFSTRSEYFYCGKKKPVGANVSSPQVSSLTRTSAPVVTDTMTLIKDLVGSNTYMGIATVFNLKLLNLSTPAHPLAIKMNGQGPVSTNVFKGRYRSTFADGTEVDYMQANPSKITIYAVSLGSKAIQITDANAKVVNSNIVFKTAPSYQLTWLVNGQSIPSITEGEKLATISGLNDGDEGYFRLYKSEYDLYACLLGIM